MTRTLLLAAAVAIAATTIPAAVAADSSTAPRKTLTAFASEQELTDFFKRWAEEAERRRKEQMRLSRDQAPAAAAAPAPAAQKAEAAAVADSITNVQHAGVDEGGRPPREGPDVRARRRRQGPCQRWQTADLPRGRRSCDQDRAVED